MGKRIFTKVFQGSFQAETQIPTQTGAVQSWLIQYDSIEVIGAQATVFLRAPSENDGWAFGQIELSQVGIFGLEGAILSAVVVEGWNTAPAGIALSSGHVAVTFPEGFAVPIKEEGYLYINSYTMGKSAGISGFAYEVVVYYTKKGAR